MCAVKSVTTRGYHKQIVSGRQAQKCPPPPHMRRKRPPPPHMKKPPYGERDPPHGEK